MRVYHKARQILRTHGVVGLAQRGARHVGRRIAARMDAAAQRRAWDTLIGRLGHTRPVYFPRHEKPLVSIVIPVYNNVRLTAVCLNALLRELGSIPVEVIVVDDGSSDGTHEYLESCSGIRLVTHARNEGVVQSINDGAAVARGRYLHLLNNDTIVTPRWMTPLLRTFESRDRVGAVGSQLRAPDGSVSEAGAVIWRDGNGTNFGRGRSAKDPAVAFPREVDYCSAASMMVRTDLFRDLGGFSQEFSPAYYEDADLCFRLRAAGHRVLYQPDSVVVHFEGSTAGTDVSKGMKRFQGVNRAVFAAKWRADLAKHFPADDDLLERAARRLAGKRAILVIDSFIPFHDRSAGGRRLLAIMQLMRNLDWHVMFIADDGGEYQPYTDDVRRAGIEVIPHRGDALRALRQIPVNIDIAWVSRPDLLEKYMPELRRRTTAKIIYDTVDLHHLRLQREAELTGHSNHWAAVRNMEHDLARRSDGVVVTSDVEQAMFAEIGLPAYVVPIIEEPIQTYTAYSARQDLLFLANYTHEPNVDAAIWLVDEIMPRVWERIPTMRLTLAGAEPTPAIERLRAERVAVTGYVKDVRPLFATSRLFVAPLRFGAGMKGKIVQSLAHALPVITTSIGAEGIGLENGVNAVIAQDADAFAEGILRLYTDEAMWSQIAAQSREAAQQFAPGAVRAMLQRALNAALEQDVQVGIDVSLSTHSA